MDPKIAAIMAKMNPDEGENDSDEKKEEKKKPFKAPLNYEEFVDIEKLPEWPIRITSENLLDLEEERYLIGNPDDIVAQLKEATPVDMQMLKDLEERLAAFDKTLFGYTDMVLASQDEIETQESKDNFPLSVNKAFLTDMNESDALLAHPSRKKKAMNFKDKVLESQKKNVEHCEFPGFRQGELTELPGSLEAPQILHRVTKAQDFNPGFRKFWKKIFQSEASIAMMQDGFWWIFIELFRKDNKRLAADQGYLFDRLADSFVALFTSVNPDLKDKFFSVYPDCLAQSMYVSFREAFPESERYFGDTFKQFLCNICSEWISGIRARTGAYKQWNYKRFESKHPRGGQTNANRAIQPTQPAREIKQPGENGLEMEEFHRVIERLGQQHSASVSRTGTMSQTNGLAITREATRATMNTVMGHQKAIMSGDKSKVESSVMGRGPEMERILFKLYGQSPLVSHFLSMRQLQNSDIGGAHGSNSIRRTEIVRLPPQDQPTYRELINETKATSQTLSKEYQKVCEMTASEINRIEKNQRETNRKIEKLQRELMFCKNSLEVKIMGEKILGKTDNQETPRLAAKNSDDEEEY